MTRETDLLLDLAEAMEFREKNPLILDCNGTMPDVNLSKYTLATPEALEFLAKQGYDSFVFIGLESLSKENAMALASWDAFLCFSNIGHLDNEIAAILVAGGNQLHFDGLLEIDVELARELAKLNNVLGLSLNRLSIEVAAELAQHTHELDLSLTTSPSDYVLHTLCGHAGHRLGVHWERAHGSPACNFLSSNQSKKVFVMPRLIEETGQWLENVYIGDADFYPDSLTPENGIIRVL